LAARWARARDDQYGMARTPSFVIGAGLPCSPLTYQMS